MTLFWLLWLVVLAGVAGRLWSWEAYPWLQVARVPAVRQPVWQRDWGVSRSLFDSDIPLRLVRVSARARPRPPASWTADKDSLLKSGESADLAQAHATKRAGVDLHCMLIAELDW